jgi:uncharacterized protein
MRILAVADLVDPALSAEFATHWRAAGIDLIVSCGDLPRDYLSALAAQFGCPLFYVPGNHDGSYDYEPPEGCQSIDDRLVRWQGLRIVGLGGAPWYNGGPEQYRDWTMALRALVLRPRLWRAGGVDLVVTHAPPRWPTQENGTPRGTLARLRRPRAPVDAWPDRAHRGFPAFTRLIRAYAPRALLHGHLHLRSGTADRVVQIGSTRVIDVYGHYLLDL